MRGSRQTIRAGANDRDIATVIGTINDDIHAICRSFFGFLDRKM